MQSYKYATISQFGHNNSLSNDPITYSLTNTIDTEFHHPVAPERFTGPHARNVQLFMAQRCSEDWDGYCEFYYHNKNKSFPNQASSCPAKGTNLSQDLTTGESLLHNAVERRFCKFPGCMKKSEPFDPTVANSPNVYYYTSSCGDSGCCVPVCSVDPSTIDSDAIMNKALSNPKTSMDTLINICNTSKRNGVNLEGTKIGNFCKIYEQQRPSQNQHITNPLSFNLMY